MLKYLSPEEYTRFGVTKSKPLIECTRIRVECLVIIRQMEWSLAYLKNFSARSKCQSISRDSESVIQYMSKQILLCNGTEIRVGGLSAWPVALVRWVSVRRHPCCVSSVRPLIPNWFFAVSERIARNLFRQIEWLILGVKYWGKSQVKSSLSNFGFMFVQTIELFSIIYFRIKYWKSYSSTSNRS